MDNRRYEDQSSEHVLRLKYPFFWGGTVMKERYSR